MNERQRAHDAIFLVDDDSSVRDALSIMFTLEGFHVRGFADGTTFLETAREQVPDAVLLDVYLPGCSGLEVLRELNGRRYPAPIFMISAQGDIPLAVDAIKNGAADFLEKPFAAETVVRRVRDAIARWERQHSPDRCDLRIRLFPGHDRLTRRERDVLIEITAGASNKEAGRSLGISPRTIEVHRARIMEKLGARNAADLVRIVLSEQPMI
jgi:FixJ family two-component response regulator